MVGADGGRDVTGSLLPWWSKLVHRIVVERGGEVRLGARLTGVRREADAIVLATTGGEDVLLTLCGPALHRELAARPRNVTLATFDGGPESGRSPLFVDAISLVDAPEYRNAP